MIYHFLSPEAFPPSQLLPLPILAPKTQSSSPTYSPHVGPPKPYIRYYYNKPCSHRLYYPDWQSCHRVRIAIYCLRLVLIWGLFLACLGQVSWRYSGEGERRGKRGRKGKTNQGPSVGVWFPGNGVPYSSNTTGFPAVAPIASCWVIHSIYSQLIISIFSLITLRLTAKSSNPADIRQKRKEKDSPLPQV